MVVLVVVCLVTLMKEVLGNFAVVVVVAVVWASVELVRVTSAFKEDGLFWDEMNSFPERILLFKTVNRVFLLALHRKSKARIIQDSFTFIAFD